MAKNRREETEAKRVSNDEARNEVAQKTRKRTRIPLDGRERNILNVKGKEKGYHYCFVNDDRNNISRYLDAGYEFVEHDVEIGDQKVTKASNEDSKASKVVGTTREGKPMVAYLMRIKQEWYDEDMAAFHETVDKSEEEMKRQLNSGEDGTYGQVKIT